MQLRQLDRHGPDSPQHGRLPTEVGGVEMGMISLLVARKALKRAKRVEELVEYDEPELVNDWEPDTEMYSDYRRLGGEVY